MICLDSKCPYCRDGHHCAFVETDDLPCMNGPVVTRNDVVGNDRMLYGDDE